MNEFGLMWTQFIFAVRAFRNAGSGERVVPSGHFSAVRAALSAGAVDNRCAACELVANSGQGISLSDISAGILDSYEHV